MHGGSGGEPLRYTGPMLSLRRMILIVPVLATCSAASSHAAPSGPLGTDLFRTPVQAREAAQSLKATRPGTWREAQFRLAWAGTMGLAAVDSLFARGELPD